MHESIRVCHETLIMINAIYVPEIKKNYSFIFKKLVYSKYFHLKTDKFSS